MAGRPRRYGESWSRDELVLAFELYFRTPFAKTKANNPTVIDLARAIDRSPASVARKLGNFGSFDPDLKAKGITGLSHASQMDQQLWHEFHKDWARLAEEADRLKAKYKVRSVEGDATDDVVELPKGPSEKVVVARRRLHQTFFRDAVRANYDNRCCLTGLGLLECLIASHIVPWSQDKRFQADPRNGLCLSATFDRLFDAGLMTIADDFVAVFAKQLKRKADKITNDLILQYDGHRIAMPRKLLPSIEHIAWHRKNVFKG